MAKQCVKLNKNRLHFLNKNNTYLSQHQNKINQQQQMSSAKENNMIHTKIWSIRVTVAHQLFLLHHPTL